MTIKALNPRLGVTCLLRRQQHETLRYLARHHVLWLMFAEPPLILLLGSMILNPLFTGDGRWIGTSQSIVKRRRPLLENLLSPPSQLALLFRCHSGVARVSPLCGRRDVRSNFIRKLDALDDGNATVLETDSELIPRIKLDGTVRPRLGDRTGSSSKNKSVLT